MKKVTVFVLAMLMATLSFSVMAAPVYYTDRGAFLAAAGGGLNFESFEDDYAVSESIVLADFTVGESNGTNAVGQVRGLPALGLDNAITDGTGAIAYDDNGTSVGTFFDFSGPFSAFGIDITTNEDSTVTIGGDVSDSINLTAATPSFWGVIDVDGFSSITFDASGEPNVGFDSAEYGVADVEIIPVPVNSNWAMILMTLMLLAFGTRAVRRRLS